MKRQARVSARKSVDGARQLTFEYISSLSKFCRNSSTRYGHPGQSAPISRGAKNCETKRAKQANNFIILARVGSQVLFYFARKAFWTDRCGKFICGTGSQGPGLILPFYCVCECAAANARCRESYFKVRARRQKARDRESSELEPSARSSIWCFVLLRGDWRAFNYRSRSLLFFSAWRATRGVWTGECRGEPRAQQN